MLLICIYIYEWTQSENLLKTAKDGWYTMIFAARCGKGCYKFFVVVVCLVHCCCFVLFFSCLNRWLFPLDLPYMLFWGWLLWHKAGEGFPSHIVWHCMTTSPFNDLLFILPCCRVWASKCWDRIPWRLCDRHWNAVRGSQWFSSFLVSAQPEGFGEVLELSLVFSSEAREKVATTPRFPVDFSDLFSHAACVYSLPLSLKIKLSVL